MSDGARFAAVLFSMVIMILAVAGITAAISLQRCAICDNNPPNYLVAALVCITAAALIWFLIRVVGRLLTDQVDPDRENPR